MNENERKAILEALKDVDEVVITKHQTAPKDMSVSQTIEELKPDIFANGGDRDETNAANPESSLYKDIKTCERLGIKIVYNVGGEKAQSSSELVHRALGIKSKTLK